jgi:hypothetical protein
MCTFVNAAENASCNLCASPKALGTVMTPSSGAGAGVDDDVGCSDDAAMDGVKEAAPLFDDDAGPTRRASDDGEGMDAATGAGAGTGGGGGAFPRPLAFTSCRCRLRLLQ